MISGFCRASVFPALAVPLSGLEKILRDWWFYYSLAHWRVSHSACQHAPRRKASVKKTLLWALKSELQPIPAEGCDERLLLWSCHLNNDAVVWFEKTTSNEKAKFLSYMWLGRYQLESSPGPQPFLKWCTSKSTFRVVSRGHICIPSFLLVENLFFTSTVLLDHLVVLLLLWKLCLIK